MYRVRTVFTGVAGTPWYSNLYFDDQDPGGPEGAIDAVYEFWSALVLQVTEDVTATIEGEVAAISPGTGDIENVFTYASRQRTFLGTGDPLPWQTQGLLRYDAGVYVGGRRMRGRINIPGPTESDSGSGVPGQDYLTALTAAGQGLIASDTATWVVYSRRHLTQSPVTGAAAAPYWAVLRSRRD